MMSISDWISIICAGVALIVTVIIAVLQIRQSNRMERFEKRQDKRDEAALSRKRKSTSGFIYF